MLDIERILFKLNDISDDLKFTRIDDSECNINLTSPLYVSEYDLSCEIAITINPNDVFIDVNLEHILLTNESIKAIDKYNKEQNVFIASVVEDKVKGEYYLSLRLYDMKPYNEDKVIKATMITYGCLHIPKTWDKLYTLLNNVEYPNGGYIY